MLWLLDYTQAATHSIYQAMYEYIQNYECSQAMVMDCYIASLYAGLSCSRRGSQPCW